MSADEIRQLVRYRVSQARAALADARCLLDGSGSAMSVINRSYYGMFYAVLALLQSIGKAPSKHAGVISLFDREFVREGHFDRSLSKDLHRGFELRQAYDYRATEPASREQAQQAWERAARFVEAIASHLDVEA